MEKKEMTIWATILAVISGGGIGGTLAGYEAVKNHIYEIGDERWVTIASQNLKSKWELEDELSEIDRQIAKHVQRGEDVTDLLVRKAVLEERLRQVE